jgi:hypothetical protein
MSVDAIEILPHAAAVKVAYDFRPVRRSGVSGKMKTARRQVAPVSAPFLSA